MLERSVVRAQAFRVRAWKDYSRLLISKDYAGWSLDADALALQSICTKQGIRCCSGHWAYVCQRQVLFLTDQFSLLNQKDWGDHRVGFAYFHGRPGSGIPEFDQVYENLRRMHKRISRIQVSHLAMRELVLKTGIDSSKVKIIPIGVDARHYVPTIASSRDSIRRHLGIPTNNFVVGSFQKDGVGWGDGEEPKLIKGPDILLQTLALLKQHIPELFILLTGPARGYIKRGLTNLGIPFRHVFLKHSSRMPSMYHALDVCLVTSRQEGGPKAVLESMASGVPLVTTRVGQAMDLVRNGENGFMVDVEDVEGLVHAVVGVCELSVEARHALLRAGRATAEANAWERQGPLWKDFFAGVLE
jgi:glycosyltransferase involved in cell wall biosynthesis